MAIESYREIKKGAYHALKNNPGNLNKTVLLYGGIPLLLSLVLTGLQLLMDNVDTGVGLDGIQNYGLYSTAFTVVQMASYIFQLFWAPGVLFCGLMVMRGQDPYPHGLFQGLRSWKAILLFTLLLSMAFFAVYMFLATGIAMAGAMIWSFFTTMDAPVPQTEAEMQAYMEALSASPEMNTLAIVVVVVSLAAIMLLYIPVSYRLRLVYLLIMDKGMGAMQALVTSIRLTKGSCLQLFFMDLSFWWYYLLAALCTGVSFLPLLPAFANMNQTVVTVVFSLIDCALSMGLYLLGIMKINTADAAAYIHLCPVEEDHDL